MSKIKVSVVSYLNSKPFVHGLRSVDLSDVMELYEDIPSDCASKLIEKKVDVGLIPVAVIPLVNGAHIISDYCIGADGEVNSVFLFSNTPVEKLNWIYLDRHSRTSNNLTKVLAKEHWKIKSEFKERTEDIIELKEGEGMVLIGDRTFGITKNYEYVYDLSAEWKKLTGLPFVFAAWVANRPVSKEFTGRFNEALRAGVTDIQAVIAENLRPDFDVEDYITHKLDYNLDDNKRKALDLFLQKIKEL